MYLLRRKQEPVFFACAKYENINVGTTGKKYPSLKIELTLLNDTLSVEPKNGLPLGSNTFKFRIEIRSKRKA